MRHTLVLVLSCSLPAIVVVGCVQEHEGSSSIAREVAATATPLCFDLNVLPTAPEASLEDVATALRDSDYSRVEELSHAWLFQASMNEHGPGGVDLARVLESRAIAHAAIGRAPQAETCQTLARQFSDHVGERVHRTSPGFRTHAECFTKVPMWMSLLPDEEDWMAELYLERGDYDRSVTAASRWFASTGRVRASFADLRFMTKVMVAALEGAGDLARAHACDAFAKHFFRNSTGPFGSNANETDWRGMPEAKPDPVSP